MFARGEEYNSQEGVLIGQEPKYPIVWWKEVGGEKDRIGREVGEGIGERGRILDGGCQAFRKWRRVYAKDARGSVEEDRIGLKESFCKGASLRHAERKEGMVEISEGEEAGCIGGGREDRRMWGLEQDNRRNGEEEMESGTRVDQGLRDRGGNEVVGEKDSIGIDVHRGAGERYSVYGGIGLGEDVGGFVRRQGRIREGGGAGRRIEERRDKEEREMIRDGKYKEDFTWVGNEVREERRRIRGFVLWGWGWHGGGVGLVDIWVEREEGLDVRCVGGVGGYGWMEIRAVWKWKVDSGRGCGLGLGGTG
ncbi:hypothetical protein Tco_0590229 [Tanacetum coccineum]